VVTYFDAERTLGMRSYQIWNKAVAVQSSPKPAIELRQNKQKAQALDRWESLFFMG